MGQFSVLSLRQRDHTTLMNTPFTTSWDTPTLHVQFNQVTAYTSIKYDVIGFFLYIVLDRHLLSLIGCARNWSTVCAADPRLYISPVAGFSPCLHLT